MGHQRTSELASGVLLSDFRTGRCHMGDLLYLYRMKYFLPLILGTGREGRRSEFAAHFILDCMQKNMSIETELLDVRNFPSLSTARIVEELFDDKGLQQTLERADGFVIVSPEYNHGYPGELKIFLDHYYSEFEKKPFGICGVSNGPWGGTRMIESLRGVLAAFNAVSCQRTVQFAQISDLMDENGGIRDEHREHLQKSVDGMLEQVLWYAQTLKAAKE